MNINDRHFSVIREGFKLGYTVIGHGKPVLVIGSHLYYPRTFVGDIYQHLQMIFVDHRGFGQVERPVTTSDFTLEKLIEDIETTRIHLGLEQMILLGHSGHGYLALEYAKQFPQHISHLILLAMSPAADKSSIAAATRYFEESVCLERKALLARRLTTLDAEMAANPTRAFITRMLAFAPMIWYQADYDAHSLWQDVTVIPEMFETVWEQLFPSLDITSHLDKLACPVFLGLGRYDYWNPPHLWESFRSYFKYLTIRVFEQSGHTPQLEQATRFNQILLEWLTNTSEI